jgi:hypothetical protein
VFNKPSLVWLVNMAAQHTRRNLAVNKATLKDIDSACPLFRIYREDTSNKIQKVIQNNRILETT